MSFMVVNKKRRIMETIQKKYNRIMKDIEDDGKSNETIRDCCILMIFVMEKYIEIPQECISNYLIALGGIISNNFDMFTKTNDKIEEHIEEYDDLLYSNVFTYTEKEMKILTT